MYLRSHRDQTLLLTRAQDRHRILTRSLLTCNRVISNRICQQTHLGKEAKLSRRRFNSGRPECSRLHLTFQLSRPVNNIPSTPQHKLLSSKPTRFKRDRQPSQPNPSSKLNFDQLSHPRAKLKISHLQVNLHSNLLRQTSSPLLVPRLKTNLLLRHSCSQPLSHSPLNRLNSVNPCSSLPKPKSNSRARFHLARTAAPIPRTSQITFANSSRFRRLSATVHSLASSASL